MSDTQGTISVKFVVAGGSSVGTTTFVSSVSEIDLRQRYAAPTPAAVGTDVPSPVGPDSTPTETLDVGRIAIGDDLVVYLFGAPGHERIDVPLHDIAEGALGAVILVDRQRLKGCVSAVDYFEAQAIPFVVAVDNIDRRFQPELQPIRAGLDLDDDIVVMACDARDRSSVKAVLLSLTDVILGGLDPGPDTASLETV